MDARELRQQAAWLDAGAVRFAALEVAPLLRVYAAEARARAAAIERSAKRLGDPRWRGMERSAS